MTLVSSVRTVRTARTLALLAATGGLLTLAACQGTSGTAQVNTGFGSGSVTWDGKYPDRNALETPTHTVEIDGETFYVYTDANGKPIAFQKHGSSYIAKITEYRPTMPHQQATPANQAPHQQVQQRGGGGAKEMYRAPEGDDQVEFLRDGDANFVVFSVPGIPGKWRGQLGVDAPFELPEGSALELADAYGVTPLFTGTEADPTIQLRMRDLSDDDGTAVAQLMQVIMAGALGDMNTTAAFPFTTNSPTVDETRYPLRASTSLVWDNDVDPGFVLVQVQGALDEVLQYAGDQGVTHFTLDHGTFNVSVDIYADQEFAVVWVLGQPVEIAFD